jgi:hypothetical protein
MGFGARASGSKTGKGFLGAEPAFPIGGLPVFSAVTSFCPLLWIPVFPSYPLAQLKPLRPAASLW